MGSRTFPLTQPGPYRLYSTEELLRLPPPTWLMGEILPTNGFAALYGAPETFKSFVAVDWTMSIATGRPWMGHEVEQGFVIYVSAEGGAGMGKRVRAWLAHHEVEAKDVEVAWLCESVPIYGGSEELDHVIERITEIGHEPVLIVIDTLARCFDGNENEQEDMGRFVQGVDQLRETGATVLVIHHTNVGGTRERGNTAFRGAADAMVYLERHAGAYSLTASCTKQKDAEHFKDIELSVIEVEGTESCVVTVDRANADLDDVLQQLRVVGPGTWLEWQEALGPEILRQYFQRLKTKGLVVKVQGKWRVR